ncbi:MAG: hypothetical protein O3B09_01680, partial [Proteobacteria bacterium]|nr:hypothetical protein [Pseudomonadota bacterium]
MLCRALLQNIPKNQSNQSVKKNILNIKSNYNFLHSLAFWALSQYPDPLQFSNVTILLPSRRACREIKNIFLQASGKEALILPNIRAIGDVDYDELNLSNSYQSATSPLKYHLLLIEEIKKWNQRTNLFGKNISADQISAIAANLESFLQEVEKEKLNLEDLENVEVEELASHKQQILSFLRHFGSYWQSILRDKNIISIANYRNLMIEANAHHLRHNGSEHPIIIAGSTGSVKATAALIKVIANLENGFVLLCGLDKDLSADIWQELPDNHPQFMLKKLLNSLKIAPNQVNDLCFEQFKQCDDSLNKLTSYAMLPDYKTNIWQNINDLTPAAISHLSAIELDNSFEEARLISLIMRSQLENPDIDIALVSNCQNLTFMVREELKKWDIAIDDSKNNQLSNSPIVNYLLSIAQLWEEDFKSVNLLAILKHPLTKGAMDEQLFTNNLQKFELQFLRATNVKKNFTALREAVKQTGDEALITWFEQICTILEPFAELFTQKQYALKDALLANINCAETLTGLDLYSLEGAEEFRKFAQDINQESDDFTIEPQSYSKLLIQLMNGYSFSKKGNFHPRLHILSTMEARLVNKDVMIISGLNDGEFPSRSFAQNWLGAKMREDFGLPSFNQSIGVAAYDLGNYLGNRQVFLTRAHSNNNSPTLKSPFLLKLETVLKIVGIENDLDDGSNSYKAWLTQLNKIAERQLIKAPCPKPKLADRPKSFSVTDIGKWLKDPYYIYAKRVLKLKKLDK